MENLSWDDVVGGTVWSGYGWGVIPSDKVERIDFVKRIEYENIAAKKRKTKSIKKETGDNHENILAQ